MTLSRRPTAAKNLGDDYRDVIGLEYLLRMLREPQQVRWVSFEHDDAGSLDDVYVAFSDKVEFIQAKYAVEPGEWSLDDLLNVVRGSARSLLQKWIDSWQKVRALGEPYAVTIRTRRRPDDELARLIQGDRFSPDLFTSAALSDSKERILTQLSGHDEVDVRQFLSDLRFHFEDEDVEEKLLGLKQEFLALGATEKNWNALLSALRLWVRYKLPEPDGRVRVGDVRKAAQLWSPEDAILPQNFPSDRNVYIMDVGRRRELERLLEERLGGYFPVRGSPGSGKSSFLSWVVGHKPSGVRHVFLHHCFLGLDDETASARLDPEQSARSLLGMIVTAAHDDLSQPEDDKPEALERALREITAALNKGGERVLVVLDGLDHIVRERDLEAARRLLNYLPSPVPDGLFVFIGTQPVQDLFPPRLQALLGPEVRIEGFTDEGVASYLAAYADIAPHDLEDVTRAVVERSQGNPLYLRYLVESTAHDRYHLTLNSIERIPDYGGNIEHYYQALWNRPHVGPASSREPAEAARLLLALLGWASIPLPSDDLDLFAKRLEVPLTQLTSAMGDIAHLLDYAHLKGGQLRPYHESLRRFVRERPEARPYRRIALEALLLWAKERADDATRWSVEWELELMLGNPTPLVQGVSREWLVTSLNAHRPHRRLIDLLRLAIDAAADTEAIDLMLRHGWLLNYALEALDDDRLDALGYHLAAKLQIGVSETDARKILGSGNRYSSASLVDVAKVAFDVGHAEVCGDIFWNVNHSLGGAERLHALFSTVAVTDQNPEQVAAYYGEHLARVSQHDVSDRDSQALWRRSFDNYLTGLVRAGKASDLRDLASSPALDDRDRENVQNTRLRLALRLGDRAELERLINDSVALGVYQRLTALVLKRDQPPPDVAAPLLTRDPVQHGVKYDNDAGWSMTHERLVWDAAWWAATGRGAALDTEHSRLSEQGAHGQFLAHLVDLGRALQFALATGTPLNVTGVVEGLSRLKRPLNPNDDDYYAWQVGREHYLERLTQVFDILSFADLPVTLDAPLIEQMSRAPIWLEALLGWLCEDGYRWVAPTQVHAVLDTLEQMVIGLYDSFSTRAKLMAQVARVAAQLGEGSRGKDLLRRSAENLIGHGYHKDLVLYEVMEALSVVQSAGYANYERDLLRLAPIINVLPEITDGDETGSFDLDLFSNLNRVRSPRAMKLLLSFDDEADWYKPNRASAIFLEQADADDPVAYAIATIQTHPEGVKAAKVFFQRHLNGIGVHAPERAEATAAYTWWLSTECPPDLRAHPPGSQDEEERQSRNEPEGFEQVDGLTDLLMWIEEHPSFAFSYQVSEPIEMRLKQWQENGVRFNREQVRALADKFLEGSSYRLSASFYDTLHNLLWHQGERERAFTALVAAHISNSGWSRYYSAPEENDDRVTLMLRRYPRRLVEFVGRTARGRVRSGGAVAHTARIVEALIKGGHAILAYRVAGGFAEFGTTLTADLELPSPTWLNSGDTPASPHQFLLEHLRRTEIGIRTRAAAAVAHLSGTQPEILDTLVKWILNEPVETRYYAGLLALALIARQNPTAVEEHVPRLRDHLAGASMTAALIFNEMCRSVNKNEVSITGPPPASGTPSSLETPKWFGKVLSQWPGLQWVASQAATAHPPFMQHMYEVAASLGLTEKIAKNNNEALRTYSDTMRKRQRYIYSRARDILEASLRIALSRKSGAVPSTLEGIRLRYNLSSPIDVTLNELQAGPRPPWLPAPLDDGGRLTTWPAQANGAVEERLVMTPTSSEVILGLDGALVQTEGKVAWRTQVMAFAYRTHGPLPDPEALWTALHDQTLLLRSFTINLLEQKRNFVASPESHPFELDGLEVHPIIGRFEQEIGMWHLPPGGLSVWFPFLESKLLGELQADRTSKIAYATEDRPDTPVLLGSFWQDGAVTELYADRAAEANLGYTLIADAKHINAALERGGWSLGWVRRTGITAQEGFRDNYSTAWEYALHNVSAVIRPKSSIV